MNCKPGDLVLLLRAKNKAMKHYVGTVRTVIEESPFLGPGYWRLDPPVYGSNGLLASWADKDLRPLRDSDGEDEMIRIAGLPSGVAA